MNERIKEFTAQLGEPSTWGRERPIGPGIVGSRWYGWSDHQQERNGYNTPLYDTAQLKQFAELIVKECAKVILETPVKYTEIDIMHIIRDNVKEHFGVKE